MLRGLLSKDAELWLECSGTRGRWAARVREQRGTRVWVALRGPARPAASDAVHGALRDTCALWLAGTLVQVHLERDGAFWVIPARSLGESSLGDDVLELEVCGPAERQERRFALRVPAEGAGIRASLEGEECRVVELCEVSFAVRARARFERGDVLEAVVYDAGEALPGRVRVESVASVEGGGWRYGLVCLDGRLKFELAGVALGAQRTQISHSRGR